MILKGISVNQDPPTKDYLWITPKGNTRFWNQSTWRLIGGSGGGGGDLSNYYTKSETQDYVQSYVQGCDFLPRTNVNGTATYAAVFTGTNSIGSATESIRIGDAILKWENGGIHIYNATSTPQTPTTAGVYADWVSALGSNSSGGGGGGGGMDETALWQELTDNSSWAEGDNKIINVSHLPSNIVADTLDGYHANSFVLKSGDTMTGLLKIKSGSGIENDTGAGLLVWHPTSWTGVTNLQWAVGAVDCQGVIRSDANNLLHSRSGTAYTILDTYNYKSYISNNYLTLGVFNDYIELVIGLIEYTGSAGSSSNQNSKGSLVYIRDNCATNYQYTCDYFASDPYQKATPYIEYITNHKSNSTIALGADTGFEPCKFTYNGKTWLGFKFYCPQAGTIYWSGLNGNYTSKPFIVAYYNVDTSTILNSEIRNSLTFSNIETGTTNATKTYMTNRLYIGTTSGNEVLNLGGWIGTNGNTGWYNSTWAGGWYMSDTNWIRSYNNKPVQISIANNNAWGIGTHRLGLAITGTSNVSWLLNSGSVGYGFCVNTDGNWYFGKRTSGSVTDTTGDVYLLYGNNSGFYPRNAAMDLGNATYPWHVLYLGGSTSATMNKTTTNPRIVFQENSNPGVQKVALTYTDYDSYGHGNKGLKVHDVDGNDGPAWFEVEGTCYVGNLSSSGYVTALVSNSSDKRLKKEIKPFNAKQIIDKLKPVEFEWNKKANKYNSNLELNKKNYGLIAQNSDGIIDDLVFDLPDGKGYKGVRYEKLIPILLQAIKEQQKEIDELKQIIKKLKV